MSELYTVDTWSLLSNNKEPEPGVQSCSIARTRRVLAMMQIRTQVLLLRGRLSLVKC